MAGRAGAALPVALAVLSGCVLPRGLALQRADLEEGAERSETRVRADSAGSLEQSDVVHKTEIWKNGKLVNVVTTVGAAERGAPASLVQTVQQSAAADGATSASLSDLKGRLEDKIAAITAQEAKGHAEADGKAKEEAGADVVNVDLLVAQAREAGKRRLMEAKRTAKEQFDKWQIEQAWKKQEKVRLWRIERKKDVAAKLLEAENQARHDADDDIRAAKLLEEAKVVTPEDLEQL